ncbi:MAG: hypothetical protein SPE88_05690, partial [Paludibacteraceae bacterium]|nr:hypothetical protein [Paludibacteraceae bacterium]
IKCPLTEQTEIGTSWGCLFGALKGQLGAYLVFIRRLLGASFGVSKKNARHLHFLCNVLNVSI